MDGAGATLLLNFAVQEQRKILGGDGRRVNGSSNISDASASDCRKN
jgi:hypothetical protein